MWAAHNEANRCPVLPVSRGTSAKPRMHVSIRQPAAQCHGSCRTCTAPQLTEQGPTGGASGQQRPELLTAVGLWSDLQLGAVDVAWCSHTVGQGEGCCGPLLRVATRPCQPGDGTCGLLWSQWGALHQGHQLLVGCLLLQLVMHQHNSNNAYLSPGTVGFTQTEFYDRTEHTCMTVSLLGTCWQPGSSPCQGNHS